MGTIFTVGHDLRQAGKSVWEHRAKNQKSALIVMYSRSMDHCNKAKPQRIYNYILSDISKDEKILCVEGIYDKYAISCFCNLPKAVRIFPSTSASAIPKIFNISLLTTKSTLHYGIVMTKEREPKGEPPRYSDQLKAKNSFCSPSIKRKGANGRND